MDPARARTRTPPPSPSQKAHDDVIIVTIAAHPELSRIGEVSLIEGRRNFELSRTRPGFRRLGATWERSLEDSCISRSGLILAHGPENGLAIVQVGSIAKLKIDGASVEVGATIPCESLAQGIIIELADRVALVVRKGARPKATAQTYGLIGDSSAICQVRAQIARLADLDIPVLLRGESGTGKELVARALHNFGPRRNKPWVDVNLAALPPSLAAGELFGRVRGAYTHATTSQQGYFRAAHSGTLFLDEVGEINLELQAVLLRALETGQVTPLGQQRAELTDVRIVAATDANLENRLDTGSFRGPLLYRLAAYQVRLPPLRERREDVGRLFVHFAAQDLASISEEHRLRNTDLDGLPWIPTTLMRQFISHSWPGNVRELRNAVRSLVIDCRGQHQLPARVQLAEPYGERSDEDPVVEVNTETRVRAADLPPTQVQAALIEARWELAGAARVLGVSRPALYEAARRLPGFRLAEDLSLEEIERSLTDHASDINHAAETLRVSSRGLRRRMRKLGIL